MPKFEIMALLKPLHANDTYGEDRHMMQKAVSHRLELHKRGAYNQCPGRRCVQPEMSHACNSSRLQPRSTGACRKARIFCTALLLC
jgi:hypothetical protein